MSGGTNLAIKVPDDKRAEIRAMAEKKGMIISSMVRNWIYERLEQEQEKAAA